MQKKKQVVMEHLQSSCIHHVWRIYGNSSNIGLKLVLTSFEQGIFLVACVLKKIKKQQIKVSNKIYTRICKNYVFISLLLHQLR